MTCGTIWEIIRVFFFGCHGAGSKGCQFNFCLVARCTFIRELSFASVYKQVQNCEDASEKEEWKI